MPLEFALRPRFDLERPAPRRRLSSLRLHPLVLPIAAYWLTIAGVTYALIRSTAVDAAVTAEHTVTSGSLPVADSASSRTLAIASTSSGITSGVASAETTAMGAVEPSSPMPALAPVEPRGDPALDAMPRTGRRAEKRELVAHAEERELVARAEPPRIVHRDVLAPEPPAPSHSVEEPPPRRSEIPNAFVSEEPSKVEAEPASLPSCESAAAAANQTVDLRAGRGAPDLTRDAFAGVLENGAYLNHCAIPGRMALDICAAVQNGRVVGVSVTTAPPNTTINACVRRAVAALRFPRNSQLDLTRTRFAPGL